jgi:hypothetical protein
MFARLFMLAVVFTLAPGCDDRPSSSMAPVAKTDVSASHDEGRAKQMAPTSPLAGAPRITEAAAPSEPAVEGAVHLACGDDLACLTTAARSCTRARGTHALELAMGGMAQRQVWETIVDGQNGEQCAFRRVLQSLQITVGDEAKRLMKLKGMSDADIDVQVGELDRQAKLSAGRTIPCTMTGASLAEALLADASGNISSETWSGCAD